MTDLLEDLKKEITELQATRDELKLKLHLAKADAKDEWERLQPQLAEAQQKLRELGEQAREPTEEIKTATKDLVAELKHGFARLRDRL